MLDQETVEAHHQPHVALPKFRPHPYREIYSVSLHLFSDLGSQDVEDEIARPGAARMKKEFRAALRKFMDLMESRDQTEAIQSALVELLDSDDSGLVGWAMQWMGAVEFAASNYPRNTESIKALIECAKAHLVQERDDRAYWSAVDQFYISKPPKKLLDRVEGLGNVFPLGRTAPDGYTADGAPIVSIEVGCACMDWDVSCAIRTPREFLEQCELAGFRVEVNPKDRRVLH